jgi:hypothetical protein
MRECLIGKKFLLPAWVLSDFGIGYTALHNSAEKRQKVPVKKL